MNETNTVGSMKVYEAVAAGLVAEGVEKAFGLMGDGNMSIWGTLARNGKVEMISAGHEAAAVAMADGYSRASGKVGVCTVTHGPGLTQVGTSLTIAVRNRSALVLIVGQVRRGAKHVAQNMVQRPFVESCGARFIDVSTPENVAQEMADAFFTARVHRVPVVLNLDVALQERSFDWDLNYRPSTEFLPTPVGAASEEAIAPLVEKLLAAERVVIIAGLGAKASDAKPEILQLGERLGALLATSLQAKGMFSGEEYDVGICGSFSSEPTEGLISDADFVLGVGAEVGHYTSEGGMMFPMADIARIDISAAPRQIEVLPGMHICGDAKKTIALVIEKLSARGAAKEGYRNAQTREVLTAPGHTLPKPTDGLDPRTLARAIGEALPEGAMLTCGNCHFWAFPAMYTPLPKDAQMRFSYQFGSIGQTVPLAIGIGAANPALPHVAIEGDGAMLMNLQELSTITRFNMNLVLVVWNDGGFGAEVHKLKAKGFDPSIAQWKSADFVALAKAFGGDGVRLQSVDEVAQAIKTGLQKGGLFVIDAPVSPTTVSDPYGKIQFGIPNKAPLLRPIDAVR